MRRILMLILSILLEACSKDPVANQEVTVMPVCESISCNTTRCVDVTTTIIDHY